MVFVLEDNAVDNVDDVENICVVVRRIAMPNFQRKTKGLGVLQVNAR